MADTHTHAGATVQAHARLQLGERVCELELSASDVLRISLTVDSEASLHAVEDVADRHSRRFAFKENLTIQWVEGA
jgi:hypothetical protein